MTSPKSGSGPAHVRKVVIRRRGGVNAAPRPLAESVNIKTYPTEARKQQPGETCTVGDLHGNTMKLLWILMREGAIARNIPEKDFEEMQTIYYDHGGKLTPYYLRRFLELLGRINVQNSKFNLRLIGDVFADRGKNDYLTLKVLEKLHKGGIKPEILYSNHDATLLDNYEKPIAEWEFTFGPEKYKERESGQQHSLDGLSKSIGPSKERRDEVIRLVHQYVIPNMRLLSYAPSKDGEKITIFMHAPNNFTDIVGLAQALGVPYKKPTSALELAKIIDGINEKWAPLKNQKLGLHTSETDKSLQAFIFRFIWNRLTDPDIKDTKNPVSKIDLPSYPQFVTNIVHGHTLDGDGKSEVTAPNCPTKQIKLDTELGFTDDCEYYTDKDERTIVHGRFYGATSAKNRETITITTANYNAFVTAQSPEYIEAQKWIKAIEARRDEELFKKATLKTKSYTTRLEAIASAAHLLLNASMGTPKIAEIKETFSNFKEAIDSAQANLYLPELLTWENISKNFLFHIPNFSGYVSTPEGEIFLGTHGLSITQKPERTDTAVKPSTSTPTLKLSP